MKPIRQRLGFLVALLIAALPAFAQTFQSEGIFYNVLNTNSVEVTEPSGTASYSGNIVIPESVIFDDIVYTVTRIGSLAFSDCEELTSVKLPKSILTIGVQAFQESGISSIVLPDALTTIKEEAFADCQNLTDVTFGSGLFSIGMRAFSRTKISSAILPDGLDRINDYAFAETPITMVVIPSSVVTICEGAFEGCTELVDIWCYATTPPKDRNSRSIFGPDFNYKNCTLHIPESAKSLYLESDDWKSFFNEIGTILITEITLDKTETELIAGNKLHLTATIEPTDANNTKLAWASNDESVATVNENGVVTALRAGTATITASATDGSEVKAECVVTVKAVEVVYTITLDMKTLDLTAGQSATLKAETSDNVPEGSRIVFTSSDANIATVNEEGVVTAVAAGTASVTATLYGSDDSILASDNCTVTVKAEEVKYTLVLDAEKLNVEIGKTAVINAENGPEGTYVVFETSDAAVATVKYGRDENGKYYGTVTAVAPGTATITAHLRKGTSNENLATATCEVTVEAAPEYTLKLDSGTAELLKGETTMINVLSAVPDGMKVGFVSDNKDVATVENKVGTHSYGIVTAVGEGTATITASLVKGEEVLASDECAVTVYNPITKLLVGPAVATIIVDDHYQLEAFINEGTNPAEVITWTSANPATATVDQDGLVTAVAPGYVNIYAVASNNLVGFCTVTVVKTSDMGGVEGVEGDSATMVTVEGNNILAPEGSVVYNLNGVAVNPVNLAAGVYIVRLADGQTVKVAL